MLRSFATSRKGETGRNGCRNQGDQGNLLDDVLVEFGKAINNKEIFEEALRRAVGDAGSVIRDVQPLVAKHQTLRSSSFRT